MTVGIALAAWKQDKPVVMIAADSRLSRPGGTLTDGGIKTYDIGPLLGMVSAGSTLPPMTASEIVRPFFDMHNRARPQQPLSFFDSVRTIAFFLDRVASQGGLTGESVIAGFFRSGAPGLAHIVIDNGRSKVKFIRPAPGGYVVIPLGQPLAKEVLLRGMMRAVDERRPFMTPALGLMHYMVCHEGDAFGTIGGGLSMGVCSLQNGFFEWPAVEIGGRRYFRGLDVSGFGEWPQGERIDYDESWCASVDESATGTPVGEVLILPPMGAHSGSMDLAEFIQGDEAFRVHNDPQGF